jgi:hypothetical protein
MRTLINTLNRIDVGRQELAAGWLKVTRHLTWIRALLVPESVYAYDVTRGGLSEQLASYWAATELVWRDPDPNMTGG